jgi:hypothetical protein
LVLLPTGAAVLAGLQVYLVANGDSATFRYLLGTLDIQAVLLSQVFPMVASMLLVLSLVGSVVGGKWVFLLLLKGERKNEPDPPMSTTFRPLVFLLSLAVAVTFATLVTGFILAICAVVAAIASWLLISKRFEGEHRAGRDAFVAQMILTPILVQALSLIARPQIWIPAESAKLNGASAPTTIYPLAAREDQLTFIDTSDRQIKTLPIDKVTERAACDDIRFDGDRTLASQSFPRYEDIVGPQRPCPPIHLHIWR